MPRILRRIPRLFHGPQRQPADHRLFRRPLHFSKQFLYLLGPDLIAYMDMVSEIIDKRAELPHLLLVGSLMSPVQKRQFSPEILFRHSLIGEEHKILNDPGRGIPFIRLDRHRVPVLIQLDLCLREVKINRSPLPSLFS